ncbi:MAG: tetrahydromethanopterin:alpha-L-glutamate ligase [Thermoproteota archaeon]|nr:tetrahydromethanopterin:alpha-L-glutamate ligase [Thermoproteota archaeon]
MKLGLLTRNKEAWCSKQLIKSIMKREVQPVCFQFPDLTARVSCKPEISMNNCQNLLDELDAILVRPIGRGSLDEIIFRLDLLHRMERLGLPIVNSPSAIEKAVDKYHALAFLEEGGIPIPKTIVTENAMTALKAFYELGSDVVVKPIFGSRGIGITRVTDAEVASRIFRTLSFFHNIIYLQEFIPHGTRDIRILVVGERAIAAMYRVALAWKTNISQGANPVPFTPEGELKKLAVRASKIIGCEVAGVDVMEGKNGFVINEINSQPGFKGLQLSTGIDVSGAIIDYVLKKVACR